MKKDEAPYSGGTAEEFMEKYALGSGVTIESLKEYGRVPIYVSACAEYDFPHWEMGRVSDDACDRRNESEGPVSS